MGHTWAKSFWVFSEILVARAVYASRNMRIHDLRARRGWTKPGTRAEVIVCQTHSRWLIARQLRLTAVHATIDCRSGRRSSTLTSRSSGSCGSAGPV